MAPNPPAMPNNEPPDLTLLFYESTELASLKQAAPKRDEGKLAQLYL